MEKVVCVWRGGGGGSFCGLHSNRSNSNIIHKLTTKDQGLHTRRRIGFLWNQRKYIKLLKSYLSNRTQYVHYNSHDSDKKTITHGVPQDSMLGPLLFFFYINDFSRSYDLLFSISFADDTSVIEGTNYDKVIDIVNKELELINIWLRANQLTFSVKDTLHDVPSHIIKHNLRNITINGKNVAYNKNTKFMCVIIDNKLTWSDHIIYIWKKSLNLSVSFIKPVTF